MQDAVSIHLRCLLSSDDADDNWSVWRSSADALVRGVTPRPHMEMEIRTSLRMGLEVIDELFVIK